MREAEAEAQQRSHTYTEENGIDLGRAETWGKAADLLAEVTGIAATPAVAAGTNCAVATPSEAPFSMEETIEAIWAITNASITAGRHGTHKYQAITVGVEGYGSSYADALLDLVHLMAESPHYVATADALRALEDRLERMEARQKGARLLAGAIYPTHSSGAFGIVGQTVPVWDHASGEVAWIDRAATVFVFERQKGTMPRTIYPGGQREGARMAAIIHHGGECVDAISAGVWQSTYASSFAYVRDPVPPGDGPLFLATVRPTSLTPEEHNAWEAAHRLAWVRPLAP